MPNPTPNPLCQTCTTAKFGTNISGTNFYNDNWGTMTWSLNHITNNSQCPICRVLHWMFKSTPDHEKFANGIATGISRISLPKTVYIGLSFMVTDEQCRTEKRLCSYKLIAADQAGLSCSIDTPAFNAQTARSWLDECDQYHACMDGAGHHESFGFRVIDIEHYCVVHAPPACRYAALSYVWGNIEQPQLMVENVNSFGKEDALLQQPLPQTIIDAIQICKLLQIRYLWVDSLCIIQNSPSHAEDQIAHMDDIYSGAYCTLIAAAGSDCSSSIFPTQLPQPDQHTVTIDNVHFVATPHSVQPFEHRLNLSKWHSRAWTMQEYVLSRRCLIFTTHEYFLYCGKGAHIPTLKRDLLRRQDSFGTSLLSHRLSASPGRGMVYRRYASLVSLYVMRHLSYQEDILRAFEGMARALRPYLGDFHYGLPSSIFHWSLCWMISSPDSRRTGFPSWSWAGWLHYSFHSGITHEPPSKSVVNLPDFSPKDISSVCPIYYWTAPNSMKRLDQVEVGSPSSLTCLPTAANNHVNRHSIMDWINRHSRANDEDSIEEIYSSSFSTHLPAFHRKPSINIHHIITLFSYISVLPVPSPRSAAANKATQTMPILNHLLCENQESPHYAYLGRINDLVIVLSVEINFHGRKDGDEVDEITAYRSGNTCLVDGNVWFEQARKCILHLL